MPVGYARRLGRKTAQAQPTELRGTGWFPQTWASGSIVEVYDVLSWEPYRTSKQDERDFLRGFEDGLSAFCNGTVHLRWMGDRGNGHFDYLIVAGPRPRRRLAARRLRRLRATRELQANRQTNAYYDWYDSEGKVIMALLVSEGHPSIWKTEVECRGAAIHFGRNLRPGYLDGKAREDAVALARKRLNP